ncbi:MAG: protein kinase [Pyrinomonadaceae bacterium]
MNSSPNERPLPEAATEELSVVARGKNFGHYEIVRELAAGGMGAVYLAKDQKLDRLVAVKVVHQRLQKNQDNIRRFAKEAKAASALNHPNILTIYEIGSHDGAPYIVSEFIEGKTLREILNEQRLDASEAIEISTQIASALSAAHKHRIIHRDIKPENIIVRDDGYVKVLDFGLAKLMPDHSMSGFEYDSSTMNPTVSGVILGTVKYMSPEQARGETIDGRADIFSLGIVTYEMITGRKPFEGDSVAETFANLINKEPEPIDELTDGNPVPFHQVVMKMLRKDPDERYSSADELLSDLRVCRQSHELGESGRPGTQIESTRILNAVPTGDHATITIARSSAQRLMALATAVVFLTAALAAGMWLRNRSNVGWAKEQVPKIDELANSGSRFEAYDLALEVEQFVPDDPGLLSAMPSLADSISITSEPGGASVYLKRFQPDENGKFPERSLVGTTPISQLRIPRGPQILFIEKEGYAPVERSILGNVATLGNGLKFNSPPIEIRQTLVEAGSVPDNMIFVPGSEYRLTSSLRPTEEKTRLDDFLIDKYEVSNKDYKEFITAGGYLKMEYWKFPIVNDGRTLSWDEAMKLFRDRTSLPGPREWSNQDFPQAKADYPVTGISWFEAAAYAEFRGKSLPTIFQWEKAARDGRRTLPANSMPWGPYLPGDSLIERANFDNKGTLPVNSGEFGLSPFGALNMAGNAAEWVLNEAANGHLSAGGAWGEPAYNFGYYVTYPGLYESEKVGFRCVRLAAPELAAGDQGSAKIEKNSEVPAFPRITDAQFQEASEGYSYTNTPLGPEVVEVIETANWRREKITFDGADGERAIAYLYLPHNAALPLQVIEYVPGSDVDAALTAVTASIESWMAPVIKSGRAIVGIVAKGQIERPWPADFAMPSASTAEYRDILVNRYTDYRRGLDYLETRSEIDSNRIAFLGISAGAHEGLILAGLEHRYRSFFLMAAGIRSTDMQLHAGANPVNFVSHIRGPTFILNGQYDEAFPVKTSAEPLLKLLKEPKHLELYDGPHAPPPEVYVPAISKFLDETLGPVNR